jgi:hypothetical protein
MTALKSEFRLYQNCLKLNPKTFCGRLPVFTHLPTAA